MLEAIILAGGFGTRLAPILSHLPKTLAPIQGTPFLQLLFHQLEQSGLVSKVILALGYKAADIESFLKTQKYSFKVDLSIEPTPLGTGGALLYALPKTTAPTLLVLNGDSYFDLSLLNFIAFHREKKADLTIACHKVDDISRYGSIEIDPSSRILNYREKSPISEPGWINAGLYLIEKPLLTPFQLKPYSIEKDLFPQFLSKRIYAYQQEATFIDIGTPNSYNQAQQILKPWVNQ